MKLFTLLAGLAVATPALAQSGTVRLSDGQPAANVAVLRVEPGDRPDIANGQIAGLYGADLTSTNDDGQFDFGKPSGEPIQLVALSDDGYAELDVPRGGAENYDLQLGPWAAVEVIAAVGGEPVAGAEVYLQFTETIGKSDGYLPAANHWQFVNVDADGRLTLDKLKPGPWQIAQSIRFGPTANRYPSHMQAATLVAGETLTVTLGGGGRAVTMQLQLPELDPPLKPQLAFLQNDWQPALSAPYTYGEMMTMTQEEREAALASPAFQAWTAAFEAGLQKRRMFVITIQPDGTALAEDVPEGEYFLYVSVKQASSGGAELEVDRSIVVPAGEGPFDLGTLPMRETVSLGVGDAVPDIAFKDTAGKDHKLSDYRGKFVLLDAWATWCGPCIGETPNILAVQEECADDSRCVIIGLSMDDNPQAAAGYTAKKGLTWVDGFIGQGEQTDVDDILGIGGIPDIRLIGPDGRLIATGLRGEAMVETVREALKAE